MNLHACLGVGPGHQLLLGTLTPTVRYDRHGQVGEPVRVVLERPESPRLLLQRRQGDGRLRRSRADAAALRERVKAALERNECRAAIAMREKIDPAYIHYIAGKMGVARTRRTSNEVRDLASRGRDLMAANKWSQQRAARELGVSGPYLNVIMSKYL